MKKVFFFLVSLFCFVSIYVCVLQTDCFGELANLSVADAENSVNQNNFGDSGNGIDNYEDETFTVKFYDYDKTTVLHTGEYTAGNVTYDDPTKELNDGYTYTFTGWKNLSDDTTVNDLSTITTTTSVYATYSITFIVTFYDSDKTTKLDELSYTKGVTVEYGDPTKTSEDYNYEFSGWAYLSDGTDADLSDIKTTTSVYATYKVTFSVTFYDYDKTSVLATKTYTVGTEYTIMYGDTKDVVPTKSSSNGYTYTFVNWKYMTGDDATLSKIETNTSVYAYYTATFTVTFYTSDSKYTTLTFNEGDKVSYTETTPTKDATNDYTYTFAYWVDASGYQVDLLEITTSTKVYAYFTATAKFFNVYFYDTDKSSLLYTGTYYTGTEYTIEYKGEALTKEDDKAYENYTLVWKDLSGFSVDLSEITSTYSVYANFVGTAITYSVTIYTAYVDSGVTSEVNKTIDFTIESEPVSLLHKNITGYTFTGYTTSTTYENATKSVSITISSTDDLYDRTYYAWYTVSTYTVIFSVNDDNYGTIYNGDSELTESLTVSYGSSISVSGNTITITDASSKKEYTITATANQSDGSYNYSFYSWSISTGSSTSTITKETTITAYFTATLIGYKIEYNSTYLSVYNGEDEVGTGTYLDSGTKIVVVVKTDKITEHYHFGYVTLTYSDETTKTVYVYDEDGDNEVTITVDGSMSIEMAQVIDTHTITFFVEEEGYGTLTESTISSEYGSIISVSGAVVSVQYQSETAKKVTASATEKNAQYSYEFSYFKIYGSSESLTEMTLTEDIQIVAVFVRTTNQYSVTFDSTKVSVELNGQAISNGDYVYYGSVLTVTYNQEEHYHMTSFLANGTAISNNQVTVTENVTITYAEEIDKFLLTFGDGITVVYKGTENQISSGNYFNYGTEFTASYTLSKNYKLVSFTCNNVSVENNYTFALSENVTLSFEEEKDVILITVAECSNGTISVSKSAVYGETVQISVSPDEDYKLSKIYYVGAETGDEITIENLSFVMPNEQITIYAEFELAYYILKDEDTEIIVKIDRTMFETEPVLTVQVETENYVDAANSLFNGSNYVMHNISILVNGEGVSTFGDYITIIVPFECENSELAQVVYLNENGYSNLSFNYDEETGFLIQTKNIGIIAVGEVTQTAKNPVSTDDTKTGNSNTTTIIIIASSVGGTVAVGGVGTFIILRRRRRI